VLLEVLWITRMLLHLPPTTSPSCSALTPPLVTSSASASTDAFALRIFESWGFLLAKVSLSDTILSTLWELWLPNHSLDLFSELQTCTSSSALCLY
jgi:hypothetical protein